MSGIAPPQLGGRTGKPRWIRNLVSPVAPACKRHMRFLGQLGSHDFADGSTWQQPSCGHLIPGPLTPATCGSERYVTAHAPLTVPALLAHLAVAVAGQLRLLGDFDL